MQSTGGAVYLRAESDFPPTRLQLQDMESGEVILLDVRATGKGPTEPVKIIYSGDVSTASSAAEAGFPASGAEGDKPQAKRKKSATRRPFLSC